MKRPSPPEVCPVCGEDVPRRALACPECGADERSGWREDADEVGADLGLDDDEFDYDEFVQREFGGGTKPKGISPVWWVTAIVLLVAFALFVIASTN
ncbi:MAG: zinc ribbon domain-containing protein [Chthoniobacterales bacterium]